MCLATPGRIVRLGRAPDGTPFGEVDFGPIVRTAQLLFLPEAGVGDYVIVQAGFAIRKLPEAEALECRARAGEASEMLAASSNREVRASAIPLPDPGGPS